VHVFQLYPFLEQSRKAFKSCRNFVLNTLPEIHRKHAQATIAKLVDIDRGIENIGLPGSMVPSTSDGRLDINVEGELEKEIIGNGSTICDGVGEVERKVKSTDFKFGSDGEDEDEEDLGTSSDRSFGQDDDAMSRFDDALSDAAAEAEMQVTTDVDGSSSDEADEAESHSLPSPAPHLSRMGSSKSSSHIHSSKSTLPPRIDTSSPLRFSSLRSNINHHIPSAKLASSRSQPQSPTRLKPKPQTAAFSPTWRFNSSISSSSITPLVPSLTRPTIPRTRTRSRTISHPDIVHLLQQYAESGPANRTTTYQHAPSEPR